MKKFEVVLDLFFLYLLVLMFINFGTNECPAFESPDIEIPRPTWKLSLIRWRKRIRIAAGRLDDDKYRIHLTARDGQ